MASRAKQNIIAVGYEVPTSDIIAFLKECKEFDSSKLCKNLNIDDVPSSIKAGVLYAPFCKGNLGDVHSTPEAMTAWYKKKYLLAQKDATHGTIDGLCREIYFRNDSIVAHFSACSDAFFVVILSTSHTTQYKHLICNNTYGGTRIESRIHVPIKPYIHCYGK